MNMESGITPLGLLIHQYGDEEGDEEEDAIEGTGGDIELPGDGGFCYDLPGRWEFWGLISLCVL